MILGLSVHNFTLLHVGLSLVGILTGLIVLLRMVGQRPLGASNTIFLFSTILTGVSGFFFPTEAMTPGQIAGGVLLFALAAACASLWLGNLYGNWRIVYVVSAAIAVFLNLLIAIMQAFQKVPVLHALAPTGREPVEIAALVLAFVVCAVLGYFAIKRFRPGGM